MSLFFGNMSCAACQLETRFLVEKEDGKQGFLLLGDLYNETLTNEILTFESDCDYCQNKNEVYIQLVDGVISDFLNKNEIENVESGEKIINKAKEGAGLEIEKLGKLGQFHEEFTTNFSNHPEEEGSSLKINGRLWKIERIYKVEFIEKDIEIRLNTEYSSKYWYEVSNESNQNELKWVEVSDIKLQNGLLKQEKPLKRENEAVHDITDATFHNEIIFEEKFSEGYRALAYQWLSGVNILIYNNENEIEFDIFEDDLNTALGELERNLQINI